MNIGGMDCHPLITHVEQAAWPVERSHCQRRSMRYAGGYASVRAGLLTRLSWRRQPVRGRLRRGARFPGGVPADSCVGRAFISLLVVVNVSERQLAHCGMRTRMNLCLLDTRCSL